MADNMQYVRQNEKNGLKEYGMAVTGTIGRRGQMTVPRAVRRWLNLKEGDRVVFIRRGEEIVLQPLTSSLLELRGSVPVSKAQDFAKIRKQVIRAHARKVAEGEA
jgi:AbrB family looped-hinge helix DNA binding protein